MAKHQLTISPSYVQDWTYVEAVREIFQNALDNEVKQPENKMYFNYEPTTETLTIGNKTSVLEVNSLLLGYSTKRDDDETIGRHGEGYKVALMVLLREGKGVTITNYGKKELWTTRLINSRKFKGERITEIDIKSNYLFKSPPHNNLEFIITGVTQDEYEILVKKNLNLQEREEGVDYLSTKTGELLLSENEKGNLYVSGLYISTDDTLSKGYNFKPEVIKLDRDRRLVDDFDLRWQASIILRALGDNPIVVEMLMSDAKEAEFYTDVYGSFERADEVAPILHEEFIAIHGERAIPVSNNDELRIVSKAGVGDPVLVSRSVSTVLKDYYQDIKPQPYDPKQEFRKWFSGVEHKLSDEEIDEFEFILSQL